jgi:hypothetical protein
MKKCIGCGQSKERSEFHRRPDGDGAHNQCKACRSAATRAYYVREGGKIKQRSRRTGWVKVGIDPDRAEEMLATHDGRCSCCGGTEPGGKGSWMIDHDHRTNRIRGVVCHNCNTILGHAKDSVAKLALAIQYLVRPTR